MTAMTCNYIEDEYEHLDTTLEYVLENVLSDAALNGKDVESKELCEEFNSTLVNHCKCFDSCDNSGSCLHGGNYILYNLSVPPELILNDKVKKDIFYECCNECKCQNVKCLNRLVQRGPRRCLQIIDSDTFISKGLGTTTDIPCGAFISEYAGELVTSEEAKKRALQNQKECKMNYIICLNEFQQGKNCNLYRKTFIDPSQKGNIGRYMNHSCDPNCEIFSVRVDCPIPKLGIFSARYIKAGEELCFHYGGGRDAKEDVNGRNGRVPCLCKAKNCMKFLPNISF